MALGLEHQKFNQWVIEMHLYCYTKRPNYGDALNAWLWPKVLDLTFDDAPDADDVFVGIGTLLNERLPVAKTLHIMGSGLGYGKVSSEMMKRWRVHFVRGPHTAKALSLDPSLAISDPAILLHRTESLEVRKQVRVAFMPHHSIHSERYRALCESVGLRYISPEAACDTVVAEIASSEKLITSALHGAITAEALRVPWLAVHTHGDILVSKWRDWAASLEFELDFTELPTIYPKPAPGFKGRAVAWAKDSLVKWQLQRLAKSGKFQLGSDRVLEGRLKRMDEVMRRFNEEYGR